MALRRTTSSSLTLENGQPVCTRRRLIESRRIERQNTPDISPSHLREVLLRQLLRFLPVSGETAANHCAHRRYQQASAHDLPAWRFRHSFQLPMLSVHHPPP